MYPRKFDYVRAGSVQEAIELLDERGDAKILAGGHSLLPLLKLRQTNVGTLVDIGRLPDLKGIQRPNGSVRVGALTTHAMLAISDLVPQALAEAAGNIGDWQVRNRGTVGGNVSHADPASDHPAVLTALEATFHIQGKSGMRTVPVEQFFIDLFSTALGQQEVLTAVEVPVLKPGTASAYVKLANPASGYSMMGIAVVLSFDGEKITNARVVIGGLTPRPTQAVSVGSALQGQRLDDATLDAASKAVLDDLKGDLLGDIQASAEYRRSMAPIYVRRALSKAAGRIQ